MACRKRSCFDEEEVHAEESVTSLLKKLKRMRLRPSIGQMRLEKELSDCDGMRPHVITCLEPEQLKATCVISLPPLGTHDAPAGATGTQFGAPFGGSSGSSDRIAFFGEEDSARPLDFQAVSGTPWALIPPGDAESGRIELEFSFPPQYPHKPPRIRQLSPDKLPCWTYEESEDGLVLSTTRWSPVLGVADILEDLLVSLNPCWLTGRAQFRCAGGAGVSVLARLGQAPAPASQAAKAFDYDQPAGSRVEDVEMDRL